MENNITFEQRIEQMRAEAEQVCTLEGSSSPACAVRHEVLEEMRAAKYHRDIKAARQMLKQFCVDHYCIV
jgi:CP12 domain